MENLLDLKWLGIGYNRVSSKQQSRLIKNRSKLVRDAAVYLPLVQVLPVEGSGLIR